MWRKFVRILPFKKKKPKIQGLGRFFYLFRHPDRTIRFGTYLTFFGFLLLIGVLVTFYNNNNTVEAGWWNDGWTYRKRIQIDNGSGSDLTDFQVSFTLDTAALITAGKMQSTCNDLRVVDITGNIIPHWIEENNPGCNNAATKIWTKVTDIPASDGVVYAYYGNSTVSNTESGDNVFEFFDDFNGSSLDTSVWTNTSVGYAVSGGELTVTTGAVYTNNTVTASAQNYVYEQKVKWTTTAGGYSGLQIGETAATTSSNTGGHALAYLMTSPTASYNVTSYAGDGTLNGYNIVSNATEYTASANTYHVSGLSVDNSNVRYYNNRTQTHSYSGTWSEAPYLWFGYFQGSSSSAIDVKDMTTDWVLVRKYASSQPSTTLASEEAAPGPIAYWKFDEGQGQSVYDSSENDETGYLGSTSSEQTIDPQWRSEDMCISGKCLEFDGVDDRVTVADSNVVDGNTDEVTVSLWVRSNNPQAGYTHLVRKQTPGYTITLSNTGLVGISIFHLYDTQWRASGCTASEPIEANKWHHIEGTFKKNDSLKVYLNGELVKTCTPTYSYEMQSSSNPLYIGYTGWQGSGNSYFDGFIDEVKVYPYERSAAEIKSDFVRGASGAGSQVSFGTQSTAFLNHGLVGYWKMDESSWSGVSGEVVDSSGNGNHGTASLGGTSTGSNTSITFRDTNQVWDTSALNGLTLTITGGTGSGQSRTISTNTDYQLTLSTAWDTIPDDTSTYYIHTPATTASGKYANAAQFSGSNAITFDLDNQPIAQYSTTDWTVATWVKPTSADLTGTHTFYQVSHVGGLRYVRIWLQFSDGKISARYGNYYLNSGSSVNINADNWYHVMFVRDYDNTLTLYIDGNRIWSATTDSDNPGIETASIGATVIGATLANTPNYFNGNIDEFRIYNRALSAEEVKALYEWAPGPVGYWKMDDSVQGDSQTITDSSGNGFNGTTVDGANNTGMDCTVQGQYGNACSFDGSDDYVNTPYGSGINPSTSPHTFSMWVKWDGVNDKLFISPGYTLDDRLYIGVRDSKWTMGIHTSSWTAGGNITATTDWNYITLVMDGSNAHLYVNGVFDYSKSYSSYTLNQNFDLGQQPTSAGVYNWGGLIDDVKIYNYARTQSQIIDDMNAGHPGVGSPVGHAVGYWKFDEGYGDTVRNDGSAGSELDGAFGVGDAAPSWTNSGVFGKGIDFDGVNDTFFISDSGSNSSADIGDEFSISVWTTQDGSDRCILKKGSVFILRSTPNAGFYIYSPAGNSDYLNYSGLDSGWNHIIATYDKNLGSNNMKVYVDGVLKSQQDFSNTPAQIDSDIQIGCVVGSSDYLIGKIDEVKIYNYALTADEVKLEYNQGQATVLGSVSTESDGATESWGQSAAYCVPGDTSTCNPPVAEWKMDDLVEGASQSIADTSGNNNTGTTSSANGTGMSCSVQGKVGTACEFDGVDDYIQTGDAATIDISGTNPVTYEAWIKLDQLPTNYVCPMMTTETGYNSSTFDKGFSISNAGVLSYYIYDGSGEYTTASTVLEPSKWYHIANVFSGSNDSKIYVNGQLSGTNTTVLSTYNYTSPQLVLGFWRSGSAICNEQFKGSIDQAIIYNYARTPAQIAWEYNRGKPVAWYKFDECQGTTVVDSAENANGEKQVNNGTITIGAGGTNTSAGTCSSGTSTEAWNNGTTGVLNGSLDFDGTDDYVTIGSGFNSEQFAISMWVNPDDITTDKYISCGKAGATGNKRCVIIGYQNNYVNIYNESAYPTGTAADTQMPISTGSWQHIVYTTDGTNLYGYVNGNQLVSVVADLDITGTMDTYYLGSSSTPSAYFDGQIDDVKIFNYPLTAEQVKLEYNQGAAVRFSN